MNDQPDLFALIDRLAAGELDEDARRELFAGLDGEPSRWRRCALALLEAREIEQAFGAWQSEAPRRAIKSTLAPVARRSHRGAIVALAASIMIAFSLGIFARGLWIASAPLIVELQNPSGRDALKEPTNEKSPAIAKQPDESSDKAVTTVAAAPSGAVPADFIPPYVRSQLERRGYQLTSHPARLPVVLPDGRRMTVPVDRLQLNYVGQRTY